MIKSIRLIPNFAIMKVSAQISSKDRYFFQKLYTVRLFLFKFISVKDHNDGVRNISYVNNEEYFRNEKDGQSFV